MAQKQGKHFVLVHGAGHGAWSWHKVKPRLESAGHSVTALDLAASGINIKGIHELRSFYDYAEPLMKLMASIPPNKKVILVGHSFGGLSLALAMDNFPEKVEVAIFLAALVPDSENRPSHVVDQLFSDKFPKDFWLDTQFASCANSKEQLDILIFGPTFLRSKLYQLCSQEDYTLATMLIRPANLFRDDLSKAQKFSTEGYGSIEKIYITCGKDAELPKEFQSWMIQNAGVKEVREIEDADHMAMLSKPQELCNCLLEIGDRQS